MAPIMEICRPHPNIFNRLKYDVTDNSTNQLSNDYNSKFPINMDCQFHREDERFKTFHHWPINWLDSRQLAATGMFYTGESDMHDKVKCYFCEVEIGHWEVEDQPVSEHLKWSPNCPLLRRRTTNNVPIDQEYFERLLPPISYDICGANDPINTSAILTGASIRPQAFVETFLPTGAANATTTSNACAAAAAAAIINASSQTQTGDVVTSMQQSSNNNPPIYYPEFPEYAVEQARFRSFANWPKNMKQKPEQLAEAGFFYTGSGDRVKCFSCGGGLKDWDVDDEPWEQHALWLSKCRYLKLIKGQSFIDSTTEKLTKVQEGGATDEATNSQPSQEQQDQNHQQQQQANHDVAPVVCKTTNSNHYTVPQAIAVESSSSNAVVNNENAPSTSAQNSSDNLAIISHDKRQHSDNINAVVNLENPEKKSLAAADIPEEKLCKICYAAEYNTAFLPCGHVVACAKCASSVTKCPLCRKNFINVMRVYFS